MVVVHKTTVFVVHNVIFSLLYKIILPAIRIEPTRLTTSIARVHQVYKVSQGHQKATA